MRMIVVTHGVVEGDGQGRVNLEVVRVALARGHPVIVVASRLADEIAAHPGVRWVEIPAGRLPTQLLRNLAFAARTTPAVHRRRRAGDAVLVNGFVGWSRSDVNAVHLVHHAWRRSPAHTSRLSRGPYAWYHWLYSALNARWEAGSFRRARIVVAVSSLVREQLIAAGVPAARIRVIENGVDPTMFTPGQGARTKLGLPEGVPLGLFAGDIRHGGKNLDSVLAALARIPALQLAVLGASERSPYPALAERMAIAERVHFLGYRRDVARVMRSVDFFILPSRYDSFGNVILEAMASGLPVITSATVGAAELVAPESGFVLDDPDDLPALVEAMATLASDPGTRQAMGCAARAIAERHPWSEMAGRYVDLLEEAACATARG